MSIQVQAILRVNLKGWLAQRFVVVSIFHFAHETLLNPWGR